MIAPLWVPVVVWSALREILPTASPAANPLAVYLSCAISVDGLRLRRDSQGPLRDLYSKIPIDALRIGHSQRIAPGIDGLIRQQRSVLIPRKGHLIIGGAAAHLGCCRILHRIPIIRF